MALLDQITRRSRAEWLALDPVLPAEWLGLESDAGRGKEGDGRSRWSQLSYIDTSMLTHENDGTAHDASQIATGDPTAPTLAAWLATASSRFLPQGAISGRRWLIVGDSNSATGTSGVSGKSWTTFAPRMSGGKLYEAWDGGFYETNLATSGHTSTQQLTTLQAFIAANPTYLPTLVSVQVGTNDVRDTSDPATWQANLAAYVTTVRVVAPTCQFVFHTLPPRSGPTSAISPTIIEDVWNAWLRTWCAAQGHTLIDVWRLVTDPSTREFRTGVYDTSDGVHLNAAGQYLVAQEYVRVLVPKLATPPVTGDLRNLVPTSMTRSDGNLLAPGIFTWAQDPPTGWTKTGPAGTTWGPVADTATPGGYAIELNSNDPASTVYFYSDLAKGSNWADGDRMLLSGTLRVVAATNVAATSAGFRVVIIETGSTIVSHTVGVPFGQSLVTSEYQRFQYEWAPLPGCTSIRVRAEYVKGASVSGVIQARLGSVGLYNLTALGIPR